MSIEALKYKTITILALLAMSCASDISDDDFISCWGGEFEDAHANITFRATYFPRSGVISESPHCPELRLEMEFYEERTPGWFAGLKRDPENPFELIEFEGRALVSFKHREGSVMTVVVEQLYAYQVASQESRGHNTE